VEVDRSFLNTLCRNGSFRNWDEWDTICKCVWDTSLAS